MDDQCFMAAIDRILAWLKWPIAALAVGLLPGAFAAVFDLTRQILHRPGPLVPFLVGGGLYVILWYLIFRHRLLGTFFSTLEHELTHAIFAWLTWHRVTGLRASWYRGGQISIQGGANWLIAIAPYFFPTICFVLVPLLAILPPVASPLASGGMGFAFAYHAVSTRYETHLGQTDLQRVGWLFALLFLPTANLLSMGAVVAIAYDGLSGLSAFAASVPREAWQLTTWLVG